MGKFKRFLGKLGIISPLNILFYTSKEIKRMKEKGILLDIKPHKAVDWAKSFKWQEKSYSKPFGVVCGNILLSQKFKTRIAAKNFIKQTIGNKEYNPYKIVSLRVIK